MSESTPQPLPQTYPQLRVLGWLLIVAGFAGMIFGLVYFFSSLAVAVVTTVSSLGVLGVGAGLLAVAEIATDSFANNRMLARLSAAIQQIEPSDTEPSSD